MSSSEPVMTRETLMPQIEARWHELQTLLDSLTDDQLTRLTDDAGWTIKDHVIHLARWEHASIEMLGGKRKQDTLNIPQDIWDQGEDPINAVLQQRDHDMPLAEVMQTLRDTHAAMMQKLEPMTDADLQLPYSHYQTWSTDERPIMLWVEWDTAHHFHEHIPWIKAIAEQE